MYKIEQNTHNSLVQTETDANTQVSANSIVGRSRLARGLSLSFHEYKEPISFSLAFARATNVTDAVVYYKLQNLTAEKNLAPNCAFYGWVASYSLGALLLELPCFTSRSTIQSSLDRMKGKYIDVSNSGKLLNYESYGKTWAMDKEGCYRVQSTARPADLITVEAEQVMKHGFLKACILNELGKLPSDVDGWKKLSATELAKRLPYSRQEIQTDIKAMLGSLLERHPDKPKLHRKAANEPRVAEVVPFMLGRKWVR